MRRSADSDKRPQRCATHAYISTSDGQHRRRPPETHRLRPIAELEVENGETVGRLLDKCAEEMGGGVSRRHVKLVARGKNLDESSAQL